MGRRVSQKYSIIFLLPATICYVYFMIIPAVRAFGVAMTEWNGFNSKKIFIGLDNFSKLFKSNGFWIAYSNTIFYLCVGGLIVFFLALLFAYALTLPGIRGRKFFSKLFYFPNMISASALAVMWALVFAPGYGLMDNILISLGLEKRILVWLGSRGTAVMIIVAVSAWSQMGFYLLLILAGIDKIPNVYAEAASVDGAGPVRVFFQITFPLLRNILVITVSLWMINAFKLFELVYALTQGGNGTDTIATYMHLTAFGYPQVPSYNLGLGTAIGVIIFISVFFLVGGFRKFFGNKTYEY